MMPKKGSYVIQFRYCVGQIVYWYESPARPWRVFWRRCTFKDWGHPLHEYGLVPAVGMEELGVVRWAVDDQLILWEDRP